MTIHGSLQAHHHKRLHVVLPQPATHASCNNPIQFKSRVTTYPELMCKNVNDCVTTDLVLCEHGHTQLCQNLPLSRGEHGVIDTAVLQWNLGEAYDLKAQSVKNEVSRRRFDSSRVNLSCNLSGIQKQQQHGELVASRHWGREGAQSVTHTLQLRTAVTDVVLWRTQQSGGCGNQNLFCRQKSK